MAPSRSLPRLFFGPLNPLLDIQSFANEASPFSLNLLLWRPGSPACHLNVVRRGIPYRANQTKGNLEAIYIIKISDVS